MYIKTVFAELEWQVARVRRAINRCDPRELDAPGSGMVLLMHAIDDLDTAVANWQAAERQRKNSEL